jgi:ribonuclease E
MGMRMLIDATHLEETRVVVVKGTRLEEFDYETSTKQVLKGNIYLARVTRVEPSLQAAFVEYGGNRHGFLAFSEIHPDYYQIPIADRQRLLAEQAEEEALAAAEEEAELDAAEARAAAGEDDGEVDASGIEMVEGDFDSVEEITADGAAADEDDTDDEAPAAETASAAADEAAPAPAYWNVPAAAADSVPVVAGEIEPEDAADAADEEAGDDEDDHDHDHDADGEEGDAEASGEEAAAEAGGESAGEAGDRRRGRRGRGRRNGGRGGNGNGSAGSSSDDGRRRRTNVFRRYKIQEVIKRRQIMLVQVVKEERGNKGAALTTYLSLAGRYCVLMPNTARGGGISRKIQSQADRKRLKAITSELDIPEGMGVIVRTAGMERSKPEIKRDFEFLLRSWDSIREMTLESSAPALIYEEAGLIKRSIRDLYSDQIDEVMVEGEQGYKFAHDFMQMLMPTHADRVKLYQDKIPLFHRYQVEQQLDGMFSPTVQLKSGGYIVINPTEALVSIDVNSGKSTREHNIEETAYKTNLEAAEEVARQLRLRDLAGLVVIDFIDMEDHRNTRKVEHKLKECLRNDRARIQVGRISAFGLLEMSRQRLRPSLIESSTMPCPHCQGRGYVRSIESTALQVLRAIEEEGIRDRSGEITVAVSAEVAIYLLNHKRERISDIERRYVMKVILAADASLVPPDYRIERSKTRQPGEVSRPELAPRSEGPRPITQETAYAEVDEDLPAGEAEGEAEEAGAVEGDEQGDGKRRRRRRRRRGRGRGEGGAEAAAGDEMADEQGDGEAGAEDAGEDATEDEAADGEAGDSQAEATDGDGDDGRRRRRGRRGGRRRRRGGEDAGMGGDNGGGDGHRIAPAMTPAAIGAMLDGVPTFEFDDEEDIRPAPKPQPREIPAAAGIPVHGTPTPPVTTDDVVLPEVAPAAAPAPTPAVEVAPASQPETPAAPISTGPVFETVVVSTDGTAEKAAAEPPAPKKGWWRR